MKNFLKKYDIVFILIGSLVIAIIISALLLCFVPGFYLYPPVKKEKTNYIVVEYNPSCDCYQVVDVIDEMKGNE